MPPADIGSQAGEGGWPKVPDSGLRLEMVPIKAADFEAAARLCDASESPLRAGDALHLAVCRHSRGSLATMDVALAAAGREAGLAVELIQV